VSKAIEATAEIDSKNRPRYGGGQSRGRRGRTQGNFGERLPRSTESALKNSARGKREGGGGKVKKGEGGWLLENNYPLLKNPEK